MGALVLLAGPIAFGSQSVKGTQLAEVAAWPGLLVMLGLSAFCSRRKRITPLLMLALAVLSLTAIC